MPAEPRPLIAVSDVRVEPTAAVHTRRGIVRLAGVQEPPHIREDIGAELVLTGPQTRRSARAHRAPRVRAPLRRLRVNLRRPVFPVRVRLVDDVVDLGSWFAVVAFARSNRRRRRPRAEVVPRRECGVVVW